MQKQISRRPELFLITDADLGFAGTFKITDTDIHFPRMNSVMISVRKIFVVMCRKQVTAVWTKCCKIFIALGTNGVEVLFQRVRRNMGALPEQMPAGEEGRRDSKNEQEQGRTSQQLVAGSMKALQRVVWSLIFLIFGVHLVNAEQQGNQVQQGSKKISVRFAKEWRSDGRG